jgi:DNA-binding transcriptional LysR family regulator
MDLRLLRYFAVLADELHFGRAAARLHISQPPLSQQIRLLEEEMGAALFIRSQHRVELTEAGKTLKEQAPLIFAQFERAIDLTRCAGRGEVGNLEIGIISSAMIDPLPHLLHTFAEAHPRLHWRLHEMTPAAQIAALKERRLDVCFFRVAHDDPEICCEAVMRDTTVVALPAAHPLARRATLGLRELAHERFVSFGLDHSQLARALHDCCVEAGFTPRIVQQVVEVHTLLCLVREHIGIALLPSATQQMSAGGIAFVPLAAPGPDVSLHARYRTGEASPALALFLAHLRAGTPSGASDASGASGARCDA